VRRARDIAGALRLVLFAPEDIELVRGEPAARRRYVDDLLVARKPRYAGVCADYERVLRQRNALLRTAFLARRSGSAGDLSTLEVWDAHLVRHGAELLTGRLALVEALSPHLTRGYATVAGTGPGGAPGAAAAGLAYRSSLPGPLPSDPDDLAGALAGALAEARAGEIDRGVTLVGPHRDDLLLTLGGSGSGPVPVKGYASHGECWSYAVALRLAGYRLLCDEGVEPVLVLDDVFAELDAGRRDRLARSIEGAAQTLVTCAVVEDVPAALRGVRYEVGEGGVKRV
jgi:DNA replication and repair protein RecF